MTFQENFTWFMDLAVAFVTEVIEHNISSTTQLDAVGFAASYFDRNFIDFDLDSQIGNEMLAHLDGFSFLVDTADVSSSILGAAIAGNDESGQLGAWRAVFVESSLQIVERIIEWGIDQFTDFITSRLATIPNPITITTAFALSFFDDFVDDAAANVAFNQLRDPLEELLNETFMSQIYPNFPQLNNGLLGGTNIFDFSDNLVGDDGENTILGYDGDDVIFAQAGADFIDGGSGNDILSGGLGQDTAIYSGSLDDYVIQTNANFVNGLPALRITHLSTGDFDLLTGVEYARFDGGNSSILFDLQTAEIVPGYGEYTEFGTDGDSSQGGTGSGGSNGTDAGNNISDALEVSIPWATTSGSVGGADTDDYLRFVTSGDGTLEVSLMGLSDNIDLRLLDFQGNVLAVSNNSGAMDEFISQSFGDNQLYFVHIDPLSNAQSSYSLSITVTGDSGSSPNLPDFTVSDFTVDTTTVAAGDDIGVDWRINNIGSDNTSGAHSGIYLSTNANITTGDTLLHDESFFSLNNGLSLIHI